MKNAYFSTGTLQKDRTHPALLPSYVQAEEKSISDFLIFIKAYAPLLRYWNEQNSAQDSWKEFFEDDLSILLAVIEKIDISAYPKQYRTLSDAFHHTPLEFEKEKILVAILQLILKLTLLLKDWDEQVSEKAKLDAQNRAIGILFEEVILANVWTGSVNLKSCFKGMRMGFHQSPNITAHKDLQTPVFKAQSFFDLLKLKKLELSDEPSKPAEAAPPEIIFSTYDDFFHYLDELYQSLYRSAVLIQQAIPEYLQHALQQSNHSPQMSLLLGFWEMFGETKKEMNRFTANHLNFYFKDVLQQQLKDSTPDQVFLYFELSPKKTQGFIPKGTAFPAGAAPNGKPLLYTLDKDLTVHQNQAVLFKTLFNSTHPKSPGNIPYKGLLFSSPIANSANGMGAKILKKPASWPTLGTNLGPQSVNKAQLGFAISNPILFLSEGNRQITVVLKLSKDAIDLLQQELIKTGINDLDYWEALELLINQSFSVEYTHPKGWLSPFEFDTWLMPLDQPSEKTTETLSSKTQNIGIVCFLQLNSKQPAVSAYNPKVHGLGYETSDPLLRFKVKQEITLKQSNLSQKLAKKSKWNKKSIQLNPYPLLSQLDIEEIPIYAEVEGVEQFNLKNDYSVLNPKKPFAPFGVSPIINSQFYIGNNEVFRKKLNFLALIIEWHDLPKTPKGFCNYYANYNLFNAKKPFYNSVFKWKLDLLAEGNQVSDEKWNPLDFTSNFVKLPPEESAPSNPSDPQEDNLLYEDLAEAAMPKPPPPTDPPNALSNQLAKGILDDLSQYYGPNWTENSSLPDQKETGTTQTQSAPGQALTNDTAKKILKDIGKHYGDNWIKNNPLPKGIEAPKPQGHGEQLKKEDAKNILGTLAKHYGKNWARDNTKTSPAKGIQAPLFIYQGSNFQGKPVIADEGFRDSLNKINAYAKKNNVKVHVTSSFRTNTNVKGAVVKPATRSNHLVGHAIDFNLSFKNGQWANSKYLNTSNKANWDPSVLGFLQDIEDDPVLRWGGDFSTEDPIHIDDGLNLKNPKEWDQKYRETQAAWKAHPVSSIPENDSQEKDNPVAGHNPIPLKPSKDMVARQLAEAMKKTLEKPSSKAKANEPVNQPTKNQTSQSPKTKSLASPPNPSASPVQVKESSVPKTSTEQNPTKAKTNDTSVDISKKALPKTEGNSIFEWEIIPKEKPKSTEVNQGNGDKSEDTTSLDHPLATKDPKGKKNQVEAVKELLKNAESKLSDKDELNKLKDKFSDLIDQTNQNIPKLPEGIFGKIGSLFEKDKTETKSEKSTTNSESTDKSDQSNTDEDSSTTNQTEHTSTVTNPSGSTITPEAAISPIKKNFSCPSTEGKLKTESLVLIKDFKSIHWENVDSPTPFSKNDNYTSQAKDGFLRFTLTAPDYGFGASEYPNVMSAVANHNMELIMDRLAPKTAPDAGKKVDPTASLTDQLKTYIIPIDAILKDSFLKALKFFSGKKIKVMHQQAQDALADIKKIIGQNAVEASIPKINKDLKTISDFLYAIGLILHKLSSFFSGHKERSKQAGGIFKSVFGHVPGIKDITGLLFPSNILINGAVSLLGNIFKKKHPDIPKLEKTYKAAIQAVKMASDLVRNHDLVIGNSTLSNAPKVTLLPPKAPFTPKISKITANYSATDKVNFQAQQSSTAQFHHLHPFGINIPEQKNNHLKLLPQYPQEGYLFIALNKVNAPQLTTLLFELNAQSGNRDLPLPVIKWQYLDSNQWIDFPSEYIKDQTNQFSQSGIISYYLPQVKSSETQLFVNQKIQAPYYWIRAYASENAEAVCEIINVYTNAGTATYTGGDVAPNHFNAPLPKNKISKFQLSNPEVAKVTQPLPSFGGRNRENPDRFYTRVNERLRHKDRALTAWDFEHLVLQQFPAISFVRCLNHTSLTSSRSPGNTTVVILPREDQDAPASLVPKTEQGIISQVEQYLQPLTDPLTQLHIRNPKYIFLKVDLKVILSPGLDPGHYLKLLNTSLIEEIAPWHGTLNQINPYITKLSYFSLLEFINRQHYVEEVVEFKLYRCKSQKATKFKKIKENFKRIIPKEPWIIISSVPEHQLKALTVEEYLILEQKKKQKEIQKEEKAKKKAAQLNKPTQARVEEEQAPDKTSKVSNSKSEKLVVPENALFIGNELYKPIK